MVVCMFMVGCYICSLRHDSCKRHLHFIHDCLAMHDLVQCSSFSFCVCSSLLERQAFHTQESFRVTITGRPGCSAVLCRALCCIHSIWAVQTGLVSLWTLSTLRHCCAIVLVGGSMASIHVDCVADLAFMHIRSKIMYRDIIISEGCPTKSFKRILCWGFHIRIQIS